MQESKSMRKRLAEWSKTPEGRESYEKVAEEMRKQIVPNDLEEAAEEYFQKVKAEFLRTLEHPTAKDCFIAGAKWQAEKDARDMYMSDNRHFEKCYQLGKKDMKEQMMKWGFNLYKEQMMEEAVEGVVMDFSSNRPRPQVDVLLDPHKYQTGDKVRIIIVKED